MRGRYIYIRKNSDTAQNLALAEVQVMVKGVNVAQGKTVTSSGAFDGTAHQTANLVDGKTGGSAAVDGIFASADATGNGWVQIDLGAVNTIDAINLFGRTDAWASQNGNYTVYVGSTDMGRRLRGDLQADAGVGYFVQTGTGASLVQVKTVLAGPRVDLTADASGHWQYTFYGNDSLYGSKMPVAMPDLPLRLYQRNADNSTSLLWQQSVRVDTQAPECLGLSPTGSVVPVSLSPGASLALSVRFSEDPGSALGADTLQVFGGSLTGLGGSGLTRSLSFTAGTGTLSRLARVGVGPGQLQDEAGNTNTQSKYLYVPVQGSTGAVLYPVSRVVDVRAGRAVRLDMRDPTQDLTQGSWRVLVEGLATDAALSRGVRDASDGSWRVGAADLTDVMLTTTRQTSGSHSDVKLTYQQLVAGGWQDRAQAVVSVNIRPWLAVAAGQQVEDYNNFSQVQQAWNLGVQDLSGQGVSVEAEDAWVVTSRKDFVKGHVLAGSSSGDAPIHGTGVGQRIAGAWDSGFVGVAFDANIIWGPTESVDIDNNSWGVAADVFGGLSNPSAISALVQGRGGLGRIVVMAAGNDGPTSNNSYRANQKESGYITVVSLDNVSGQVTGFSASGEATLGAASGLGGTSYAAPHVAGIVALMLELSPGLGFRDVQNILAYGAQYLPSTTPYANMALNAARTLNGVGLHFSHYAGFGSLNAYNATRMARDWLRGGFTAKTLDGWSHPGTLDAAAYTVSAGANTVTRVKITFTDDVRIDAVQLDATYLNETFNKQVFNLISPSGTVSPVAVGTMGGTDSLLSTSTSVVSKRFMGEQAKGVWTLEFSHSAAVSSDAIVKNLQLVVYGEQAQVSQRHVYTEERKTTWQNLANADARARMLWLDDRDGGQDVVMGSALTQALEVHLGRQGWLLHDGLRSQFTPGTRVENAFGGDGNDVLVGLTDGASLLLGNQGSDVLMGYGQGSQLEGGDDDDWLWVGGDSTARGGGGSDRFVVYGAHGRLTTAASIAKSLPDFDPNTDLLLSVNSQGQFEVARFDLQGHVSSWQAVQDSTYLQTLQAQWLQGPRPDVLAVGLAGQSLTLDLGMPVLHEVASYADWTLAGQAPVAASLNANVLTLTYSQAPMAGQVLDVSKAQVTNSLGLGWSFQSIYLGDGTANTLNAASQTQAVVLCGGGGNDRLTGGSGNDLLLLATGGVSQATGGAGADVFRFTGALTQGGSCTVTDFSLAQGDRLDLEALFAGQAVGVDFLSCVALKASGNDVLLNFDLSGQMGAASASNFSLTLTGLASNGAVPTYLLNRLVSGTEAVMV